MAATEAITHWALASLQVLLSFVPWSSRNAGELWISPLGSGEVSQTLTMDAWVPWWDETNALTSLSRATQLSLVLPVWYRLNEDEVIEEIQSLEGNTLLAEASKKSIRLMPTVGNELDRKRVVAFLEQPQIWRDQIDFLAAKAKEHGYVGYDFDWEDIPEEKASDYVTFIRLAQLVFWEHKLLLSVSVHARTGEKTDWNGSWGHDYAELSKHVNMLRVMAYDYRQLNTPPGPVAPLSWLTKVLDYSLERVDPSVLVVGIPLYGYDWGDMTTSVTYEQAIKRIEEHQGSYQFEEEIGGVSGIYEEKGQTHEVWFENTLSVAQKMELIQERGIQRVVFWRLGGEDPAIWQQLTLDQASEN